MGLFTESYDAPQSSPLPIGVCQACGAALTWRAHETTGAIVPLAGLPQPIASALMRTRTLTPREKAVFELLGLGYDNRSIARELQVSERTAKRHITAILAKLGLGSRLQAGLTALITLSLPTWDELPA